MDFSENISSVNKGWPKSRFSSSVPDKSGNKISVDDISSNESEPCSDVSFGWIKITRNSNKEKFSETESMASGSESDSDSSDNLTSNSELSEGNTAFDNENENEIDVKQENKSKSESSDVDDSSSEEDRPTHETEGNVNISNRPTEVARDISSDSNDDDSESNPNNEQESLKVPGNYVPLRLTGGLLLEHISDDDEVWMVQCPIFVRPEDLKGKNIMFGGTSEFAIKQKDGEEQLYETSSYTDMKRSVSCLLPSSNSSRLVAKVVEPAGLIVIKEKFCVPDVEDETLPKQTNFNIPKNLKVRHPLFGSGYEEELDARRSQIEDSTKEKKKKKKHKTKDKSDTNHKRKRSEDETEYSSSNKRQKIKEEQFSAEEEYVASEECDMENSITRKKKKKKKSKNRDSESQSFDSEENILKKKKKKSKNRETEDINVEESFVKMEQEEVECEESSPKKKKKKKHKKKSREME